MANDADKKVVALDPKQAQIESRDLTDAQKGPLFDLQNSINRIVQERNLYLTGVGNGMGLGDGWEFDFQGFFANQSCRFIKPVKKVETK